MIGAIIARQAVKSGFDALNERDLDKFMKAWAEQSVWIYPGSLSVSGKFAGKDKVRKWFGHFLEQFPQRRFTVKHLGVGSIFALSGNNTVSAYWELELTNKEGLKYQNSGVTLLTIKSSKVIQGEDFLFKNSGEDFIKIWGG
jgi:ketosteroid isomerase-like protein